MTKKELIARHVELTGRRPAKGIRAEDLSHEVEVLEQRHTAKLEAENARRIEKEQRDALLAANIARRGSAAEFANQAWKAGLDEDDAMLARQVAKALGTLEDHAARVAKFQAAVAQDAVYALEWSKDFFQSAAEARVAAELIASFEAGATHAMWKQYATDVALRLASRIASSTSPTSNLMEDHLRKAWAEAARNVW